MFPMKRTQIPMMGTSQSMASFLDEGTSPKEAMDSDSEDEGDELNELKK